MKIILPFAAALLLSACGSPANDTTTVTDTNVTDMTATDPMMTNDANGMAMVGGAGSVTVTVNGVRPNGGPVLVALQDSGSFAKAAASYSTVVQPTGASVTATIPGVAPGSYAAAVVQDTNNDGTLTLGDTGPTEPFGFSGTAQMGAPAFDPAAFQVAETGGTATVTLAGGR